MTATTNPAPYYPIRTICPVCQGAGRIGVNPTWNNNPEFDDDYACGYCLEQGEVDWYPGDETAAEYDARMEEERADRLVDMYC